jgi:hypothetical protein
MRRWAAAWASDTVLAARSAFDGLAFRGDDPRHWRVKLKTPARHVQRENKLKYYQIAKAGGRLAQLLNAIWP